MILDILRDSNINISWLKLKVFPGSSDYPNISSISDSDFPLVSGSRKYIRSAARKLTPEYNLKIYPDQFHILLIIFVFSFTYNIQCIIIEISLPENPIVSNDCSQAVVELENEEQCCQVKRGGNCSSKTSCAGNIS